MFFFFSKIFYFLMDPAFWIGLLSLVLLVSHRSRKKKIPFFFGSVLLFFLMASSSAGSGYLLWKLENLTEDSYRPGKHYDYLVVLSGYVDIGQPGSVFHPYEFNGSVDRLAAAVRLADSLPRSKIVLSGGNGSLNRDLPSEAERAAEFLRETNRFPAERLVVEADSRNTRENALETAKLIPEGASVLLITSAFHMARAAGCFKAQGMEFDTLAVDFKSNWRQPLNLFSWIPSSWALTRFLIFAKEAIGILAYRLNGYLIF